MSIEPDLFAQINNAVLDLQGAQLQTYERPLKTLVRLLHGSSLEVVNQSLIQGVDFDAFIAASEKTGGSFVGSAQLVWPDEHKQSLGLTLILLDRLANDSNYTTNFAFTFFHAGNNIMSAIQTLTRQLIIPFARDYKAYVMEYGMTNAKLESNTSKHVFIVHGHDGEAKESVARFLSTIGFKPIILHEQPNKGRTIIEKVEAFREVGFAVVLLTPDDEGKAKGAGSLEPRARQNVLFELGYFIGSLGRERVCALLRDEVTIPSDFDGVVWTKMDSGNGWKQSLGKELEASGYEIDWNLVMRS
jgi:predicted nucleotide-binding protein